MTEDEKASIHLAVQAQLDALGGLDQPPKAFSMRPLVQASAPSVTHVVWQGERMTVADYCVRASISRENLP